MRTKIWFGIVLVASGVALAACSDPPASTIIIMQETPATGGQTSVGGGGPAPVTFRSGSDAGVPATPTLPLTAGGGGSGNAGNAGSGNAGSANAGSGSGASAPGSGVPCDVATYLAAKCTGCHGNPPLPSALAGLVTYDELKATSKEDPTKNETELSVARMKNAASPMPPGALPSASDVAILQDWINAGYPTGSCGGGGDGGVAIVPTPPPSVFKGAPTFTARTGPNAHNAGKDCMSCHRSGGGDAPQFALGGTLYDGSGRAVSGAEVRLVDAKGKATSVYTGTNGTFYVQGSGFAAPAQVGVRNATSTRDMISALQASNGGACSSCHCTGGSCTVPAIHLP